MTTPINSDLHYAIYKAWEHMESEPVVLIDAWEATNLSSSRDEAYETALNHGVTADEADLFAETLATSLSPNYEERSMDNQCSRNRESNRR